MLDCERKQNSETDYGSATDAGWEKKGLQCQTCFEIHSTNLLVHTDKEPDAQTHTQYVSVRRQLTSSHR